MENLIETCLISSLNSCMLMLSELDAHGKVGDMLNWKLFAGCLTQKFSEYPTPITTGSVLTVEDYHQDFRCSLHVKHRLVFKLRCPEKLCKSHEMF